MAYTLYIGHTYTNIRIHDYFKCGCNKEIFPNLLCTIVKPVSFSWKNVALSEDF